MDNIFFRAIVATCFLLLLGHALHAQVKVTNQGTKIRMYNGSFIYVNGAYINKSVNKINNLKDPAYILGDSSSKFILTDSIANYNDTSINSQNHGNMVEGKFQVIFKGNRPQRISGTRPIYFYKFIVDKTADSVKLFQNCQINDTLHLVKGNIHLNHHEIYLNNSTPTQGVMVGENPSNRISDHRNGRGFIYTIIDGFKPTDYNENIAGLGLYIDPLNTNFKKTTIIRGHGKQGGPAVTDGGPGDGSILRYYQIIPTDSQSVERIKMTYFDNELDGLAENKLDFWVSQDVGTRWDKFGGTGDPSLNTFEAVKLSLDSTRITLSPFTCTNPPKIAFSSDTIYLCEGLQATIDAGNPNMVFNWSLDGDATFHETTQKIIVSKGGNYKVNVKDAKGCTSLDSMRVIEKNNPIDSIVPIIPVCFGDSTRLYAEISKIDLVAHGPLTYLWNLGTSSNNISHAKDTVFVYKNSDEFTVILEVTDKYGCKGTYKDTAEVLPIPVADFTVSNVCQGKLAEFQNLSTITSGGMGYSWNMGDGSPLFLTTVLNHNHNYSSTGAFPVRLIVTSNGNCKDTSDKVVNVYPVPNAGFTTSGNCQNDPVIFVNTSTINPPATMTYKWDFKDGTMSTADGFSPGISKTYSSVNMYDVNLIANSSNGCADTFYLALPLKIENCNVDCNTLRPIVDLSPNPRQICDGQTEILDAGNQRTGTTYQWSDGSGGRTLNVTTQGNYSVTLVSMEGCVGYSETEVLVTPRFNISLGGDKILCSENAIRLSPVISRTGTYSYSWGSDVGISGNASTLDASLQGKYWLTVNDLSGCGFFDRDTIEIRGTTNTMHAEFLVRSEAIVGDKLVFVQLSHPNPDNFYWNFGDFVTSTERQPVKSYALPGTYHVMLAVGNDVCKDTLYKTIVVKLPPPPKSSMPPTVKSDDIRFLMLTDPKIYPNPTEGMFTYELKLEGEATIDIQIYSLHGVMIGSKRVQGSNIKENFNLTNVASGMYFIRTILNDQSVVNRIIKL